MPQLPPGPSRAATLPPCSPASPSRPLTTQSSAIKRATDPYLGCADASEAEMPEEDVLPVDAVESDDDQEAPAAPPSDRSRTESAVRGRYAFIYPRGDKRETG